MGDNLQVKLADVDIVDVISNYLELTPSGQDGQFLGICPFHDDHNPSMSVSQNKGLFHCFACGAGGDVLTFIEKIEDTDFIGALTKLSELTGINFEMRELTAEEKKLRERNQLMSDLQAYMQHLLFSAIGTPYLKLIKERGLTDDEIRQFGLGYCDPKRLQNFFDANDVQLKEQLTTKLVETRNDRVYYPLANRIIFPLKNLSGNIVGFSGGKTNDEMKPKYRHAVNLDNGSAFFYTNIDPQQPITIVEGFYDQISLELAGVKNVLGTLGTSAGASDNKVRQLLRKNTNFVICMDGDLPGLKAAFKMGKLLYSQNDSHDTHVKFVKLPDGLDPDDFRRKNGRDKLLEVYRKQYTLPEFKTLIDVDEANEKGFDKERTLKQVVQNLRYSEDKIQAELFAKKLSKQFGVSTDAIKEAYNEWLQSRNQRKNKQPQSITPKPELATKTIKTPVSSDFERVQYNNLDDQFNSASHNAQEQAVYAEEHAIIAYVLKHPQTLSKLMELNLKDVFVTHQAFQSLGLVYQYVKHFKPQQVLVSDLCAKLGSQYPVEQVYLQNIANLNPSKQDYQAAIQALQTNGKQLGHRDRLLRDLQTGNGDPDKILDELRRLS